MRAGTMSTEEAAALLGTTARTLYNSVKNGNPPVQPLHLGTRLRWPTAPLHALVGIDVAAETADIEPPTPITSLRDRGAA